MKGPDPHGGADRMLLTPSDGGVEDQRPRGGGRSMTRNYETTFILSPVLDEPGLEQQLSKIEAAVQREGGTVKEWEKWGKRRLAFPIKRQSDGYYAFLRFEATPDVIERLGEGFKLDENILRHMHIVLDD